LDGAAPGGSERKARERRAARTVPGPAGAPYPGRERRHPHPADPRRQGRRALRTESSGPNSPCPAIGRSSVSMKKPTVFVYGGRAPWAERRWGPEGPACYPQPIPPGILPVPSGAPCRPGEGRRVRIRRPPPKALASPGRGGRLEISCSVAEDRGALPRGCKGACGPRPITDGRCRRRRSPAPANPEISRRLPRPLPPPACQSPPRWCSRRTRPGRGRPGFGRVVRSRSARRRSRC